MSPNTSHYDAMTNEDFDRLLAELLDAQYTRPSQLLAVSGVYEVLSEVCHNAVLEAWDAEQAEANLDPDAPPVPPGLRPRPGVEYGCGVATCTDCYEPTGGAR
jgi:hypothetical protein